MRRFKKFFKEYQRFHFSSRIRFYALGFGELFFLSLLLSLLTNTPIDLKFLLDTIFGIFSCFLIVRFLIGDYNYIKSKFIENFNQEDG